MKRKVIFLDVDGVLNSEKFFIARKPGLNKDSNYPYSHLDNDAVGRFAYFVAELKNNFEVKIVISSSWRVMNYDEIRQVLAKNFIARYDEFTRTEYSDGDRGQEILNYCAFYGIDVSEIIVIDDDDFDIKDYIPAENFIHTSWKNGLTYKLVSDFLNKLAV